ncbi:MAG TPA: epimerase, partial [Prolixibacteraceae bacterium]|nr:epimerase [Marinilabiliales bacterium]HCU61389.1 epimerase [Prolixibacteraceae bacterium]
MITYPETIETELQLEELLSRPTTEVINLFKTLDGDIIFLGIAGKIGPSIARMAKRACDEAGVSRRIIGVSRFSNEKEQKDIESYGIETIRGDLLNPDFVKSLPRVKNVIFLAGMKFGSEDNLSLTWAMNSYVPALVADHYRKSRIVAFSTGCVYPLVEINSGGSLETDRPVAIGEYAQSCLGRERMFEFGSIQYGTPVSLIRLNYSVEMRYGVLVDIATKIINEEPLDLSMGYFNVIWQGDMNAMTLRALVHCKSPAGIINLTGPETLSVRQVAIEFGKLLGKSPKFTGKEAPTALLSNAALSYDLFGKPEVSTGQVIRWIADWVGHGNRLLNKQTHYEVRDGKY